MRRARRCVRPILRLQEPGKWRKSRKLYGKGGKVQNTVIQAGRTLRYRRRFSIIVDWPINQWRHQAQKPSMSDGSLDMSLLELQLVASDIERLAKSSGRTTVLLTCSSLHDVDGRCLQPVTLGITQGRQTPRLPIESAKYNGSRPSYSRFLARMTR